MNLFTGNIYWNIYWHPQKRLGFPSFRNLLKQFWYIFHDSSTMDSYLACPVDRWLQPWCASHKYSHKERIQPDRVLINNGGFKLFKSTEKGGFNQQNSCNSKHFYVLFPFKRICTEDTRTMEEVLRVQRTEAPFMGDWYGNALCIAHSSWLIQKNWVNLSWNPHQPVFFYMCI